MFTQSAILTDGFLPIWESGYPHPQDVVIMFNIARQHNNTIILETFKFTKFKKYIHTISTLLLVKFSLKNELIHQ